MQKNISVAVDHLIELRWLGQKPGRNKMLLNGPVQLDKDKHLCLLPTHFYVVCLCLHTVHQNNRIALCIVHHSLLRLQHFNLLWPIWSNLGSSGANKKYAQAVYWLSKMFYSVFNFHVVSKCQFSKPLASGDIGALSALDGDLFAAFWILPFLLLATWIRAASKRRRDRSGFEDVSWLMYGYVKTLDLKCFDFFHFGPTANLVLDRL